MSNKRILILGGTGFVGRILTEKLTQSDNDVTLFNRGKRNPNLFPQFQKIIGDRNTNDIKQIGSYSWDVVIDFSCMQPFNLEDVLNLLKGKAGRYIFISSASVYPMEKLRQPIKEESETYSCSDEEKMSDDVLQFYSQKKSECERTLQENDWLDSIIFRPSLIYGKYDPTDRFYFWLYHVKNSIDILLPDDGRTKFTNTYSEDFANVIFESISITKHRKIYNASTHDTISLKDYIISAKNILHSNSNFVNVTEVFLTENEITPWIDIPMWIPYSDLCLDNKKLKDDFKTILTTFNQTVAECITWYDLLGWHIPKYGISLEKEKELIKLAGNINSVHT